MEMKHRLSPTNTSTGAKEHPFPHLIIDNFYNEEELELIWEELKFYTKPGKLLTPEQYGGIAGYTNARALHLDSIYADNSENGGVESRSRGLACS